MSRKSRLPAVCTAAALFIICSVLAACGSAAPEKAEASPAPAAPLKISAEEAKRIIDSGDEIYLLDVRTQEEFDTLHIPGAVCIPDTELVSRRDELPDNSDMTILLYCRSGRRSAASAGVLAEMGYTRVFDFGGIIDWPYETVSENAPDTENEAVPAHTHDWQDHDCNYQQCTVCGAQKRYSDAG